MIAEIEVILRNKTNRKILIKELQAKIWQMDRGSLKSDEVELLKDLAHDLDYYEPINDLRNEYHGYFGDEKLEFELNSILQKLKSSSNR